MFYINNNSLKQLNIKPEILQTIKDSTNKYIEWKQKQSGILLNNSHNNVILIPFVCFISFLAGYNYCKLTIN